MSLINDVEDEIEYLESRLKMFRMLYVMLLNLESCDTDEE